VSRSGLTIATHIRNLTIPFRFLGLGLAHVSREGLFVSFKDFRKAG
jgi:hypothetical protein